MPKPKRSHFNLLCDIGELATVITESDDIQHFLRQSANKVAAHLQVPVASIYLYDEQSRELMLWATVGLNPRAEHKIKMKPGEDSDRAPNSGQRQFIKGRSASGGVAYAPASVFDRSHSRLLDMPTIENGGYSADDFAQAVAATHRQLQKFQSHLAARLPESASLIFTAHFMMLKDKRFIQATAQLIEDGTPAPKAIKSLARQYSLRLLRSRHAYLREKVHDIRDLAGRLLKNLYAEPSARQGLFENRIIIARQLYPSEIMKFAIEGVKGLVLVGGGAASHEAILARSLKLPMIIAERPDLEELPEGTWLLLDADIGNLYVSPSSKIVKRFNDRKVSEQMSTAQALSVPAVTRTRDGVTIQLLANINLLSELAIAHQLKAAGVGLYRTGFPFLIRNSFPSEEEQLIFYQRLFKEMAGKPVTIRTLDVGARKPFPIITALLNPTPSWACDQSGLPCAMPIFFTSKFGLSSGRAPNTPRCASCFPGSPPWMNCAGQPKL